MEVTLSRLFFVVNEMPPHQRRPEQPKPRGFVNNDGYVLIDQDSIADARTHATDKDMPHVQYAIRKYCEGVREYNRNRNRGEPTYGHFTYSEWHKALVSFNWGNHDIREAVATAEFNIGKRLGELSLGVV